MVNVSLKVKFDPNCNQQWARRFADALIGLAEEIETAGLDGEFDEDALDEPDEQERALLAEAEQAATIGSRSCCQPSRCHTENRQPTTDNSPAAPLANSARMAEELGQVQGHLSEILKEVPRNGSRPWLPGIGTPSPLQPGKVMINGNAVNLGDARKVATDARRWADDLDRIIAMQAACNFAGSQIPMTVTERTDP